MYSGAALPLAAMYLRRVRVLGLQVRGGRHRRRMFEPQLRRLHLRHKTSSWASSGPAGGKQNHFNAAIRHKREVNDFACGINSRRGLPAAFPGAGAWQHARCGAGVWRHARCGGVHSCAARHAANDNIFRGRLFVGFSEHGALQANVSSLLVAATFSLERRSIGGLCF